MMSEYRKMTRLACFVADQYVAKYSKYDIECLVAEVGWEAAYDFYEMLGHSYGSSVEQILNWIAELRDE
tara:strand:- start:227 stop:433 length:207 start_codon:yes stop_codon:yes gene_type:complete